MALSDVSREHISKCENMAKMVCEASLLKTSDVRLKKKSIASRFCNKCDLGIEETANHIVMQCPYFEADRKKKFEEMSDLNCAEINGILDNHGNVPSPPMWDLWKQRSSVGKLHKETTPGVENP